MLPYVATCNEFRHWFKQLHWQVVTKYYQTNPNDANQLDY